jgi:4-hydroxythreonine-4-phosphate dehydrogenase
VTNGRAFRLAVTLGDARGIGPEVVGKALTALRQSDARLGDVRFVVVGPADAPTLDGVDLRVDELVGRWRRDGSAALAGQLAGDAIRRATDMALAGEVDGIVTGPIDKAALLAGGHDFPGHTEMLSSLTGSPTAMMLVGTRPSPGMHPLRVVLATTHIALRDVPDAVTPAAIDAAIRVTRAGLGDWFGIAEPRLALCALNPHGGDHGRFGDEDERVLRPAAIAGGIEGPFPADTVFVRAMRGAFDAVIAPYHDVGMTAIKVASFGSGVNVTLGLPFPRTSPDHGTAIDIAGRGMADPSSMEAALVMAAEIVRRVRAASRAPLPASPLGSRTNDNE